MKLLLDQGPPRSSAAVLRDLGLDTVHAGESALSTASDQAILEAARLAGSVVSDRPDGLRLRRPPVVRQTLGDESDAPK